MGEENYPGDELLDINSAAEYMSVSTKTVRRYIKSGRIRARKVRNVWYCPRAEIDKLLKKDDEKSAPAVDAALAAEIRETLEIIRRQSADIDKKLYLMSQERENRIVRPDLIEKEQEIEYLRADNQKQVEEMQRLKAELSEARANGPKDTQLLKSKQEEAETMRAVIASNERGLSLLRADVEQRDALIKQKDMQIEELRERLRAIEDDMESHGARKPGPRTLAE